MAPTSVPSFPKPEESRACMRETGRFMLLGSRARGVRFVTANCLEPGSSRPRDERRFRSSALRPGCPGGSRRSGAGGCRRRGCGSAPQWARAPLGTPKVDRPQATKRRTKLFHGRYYQIQPKRVNPFFPSSSAHLFRHRYTSCVCALSYSLTIHFPPR